MKAACFFLVFQSLASWRMRPSLILNLPNLLPGRLQSWLEAILSFSVLSPGCSPTPHDYFTLVTMGKRNYGIVHI